MTRFLLTIFMLLPAADASAHSLSIFVREESDGFVGRVYFTGGDPAAGVTVTVAAPGAEPSGETTTDADGNFRYTGPHPAGTVVFVAQTPDGHRAESELRNVTGADSGASPPRIVPAGVTTVASRDAELTALHEAIDRLEHRLWMRDVIGGIGYIFGLAGLWALWKARVTRHQR
jgi:nickel transport protein